MSRIPIREAERRLEELAEDAARGEEVVIVRGDGAAFRLVPDLADAPRPRSMLDLAGDLIGSFEGPPDLSTNKAYMEGYGEKKRGLRTRRGEEGS